MSYRFQGFTFNDDGTLITAPQGPSTINGGYVPYVVEKAAVATSAPAVSTEVTLATIIIPANAIGPKGVMHVRGGYTFTNNANNKVLRVRYSGAAGSQYVGVTTNNTATFPFDFVICNRGATNSQVGLPTSSQGIWGQATAGTYVTSSVDTTAQTTVVITGQKTVPADTLTLEFYMVGIHYGP